MTTIHGSTMRMKVTETTSNDKQKYSATDNVDTLVEATQQQLIHTPWKPIDGSCDQQGEQNKRHHTHEGLQPILPHLSIPVAPVIKRRDNSKAQPSATHQSVWLLAKFHEISDLIYDQNWLCVRVQPEAYLRRGDAVCKAAASYNPTLMMPPMKKVAHQDRMTPVESAYK